MTYRVIVTGSRKYEWRHRVWALLDALFASHGDDLRIVHGGCLTGADSFAQAWGFAKDVPVEVHLADWGTDGKASGPIRNSYMVRQGADQCVGFWLPTGDRRENRGTRDCCAKADKLGIPVLCAWGDEVPVPWHSKKYSDKVWRDPRPYPRKA